MTPPSAETRISDLEVSDAGVSTSLIPPDRAASTGRYVLTAFHARGGMGEVWRCRDSSIGREVALKRLLGDRSAAKERFLAEAQITGQLEHPSIVPVHDFGIDDTGQPFYVMKLVRGRTLKSAIEDFHATKDTPRGGSEPREVARVRLLKIFLDLCNAVAYAHSRGVIHRDLKPENVMLGPYGETILLDWGLAKLSGQAEIRADMPLSGPSSGQPALSGNSAQTQDGSILGSPLYMPPEMAEGRLGEVDQRTDVYLLGATLYEILTGRPPREGSSRQELLEMARTAPPVPPRKLAPDTPRALEAICLKAMSRGREHRYDGAMSLADEIQRFLAAEPVLAHREGALARLWRWSRRHRRALARAAVIALFIGAIAVSFLLYRNVAAAKAREQARSDLQQVRRSLDQARFYAASVDPPTERAPYYDPVRGEQAAREAFAITQHWGPHLDGLPLIDQRENLRDEIADTCLLLAQLRLASASVKDEAAEIASLLDRADTLVPAGSRGAHRLRAKLHRMNGRPDQANAEEQLADAVATPVTAHDLFLEGESIRLKGASQVVADMRDRPALARYNESLERALRSYQAALQIDPAHYWSRLQVGRCYLGLNRDAEAVEAISACIALRPDLPWGYSARGLALSMQGRYDEAGADFDRAIALDGECIPARLNRSVMYMLQEHPTDAANELQALMVRPQPPPEALYYRGELFFFTDDSALALKCMNDLIQQRPQFAPAYLLRAKARFDQGQSADAVRDIDAFMAATATTAVDLSDAAARRGHLIRYIASQLTGPGHKLAAEAAVSELTSAINNDRATAVAFADLGAVLQMQSRLDDAARAFSRAIELAPDEPQYRVDRGWILDGLNRISDAQADFTQALRIDPTHAEALAGLGYVEAQQGRYDDAERHASLSLLNGSNNYMILHNVACIYAAISQAESSHRSEHEEVALAMLRRAVELSRREHDLAHETRLIEHESAFAVSLRQRPEFKNLVGKLSS